MKLRRAVRRVGYCNGAFLICIGISALLLLYTEIAFREVDEEGILLDLKRFMKQNGLIGNTQGSGAERKQREVEVKEKHSIEKRKDSPSTSRQQEANRNSTTAKVGFDPSMKGREQKRLLSQHNTGEENCFRFEKDRPNWTIKYRGNVSRTCLQKKYHPKWTKRIMFDNGITIYRGCTQKSYRCGAQPYFDRKLNRRINTPPCCLKHIIEIFKNFAYTIKKFGGRYFLFGGGLIGWYRNRKIVPYDHDLDVMVGMEFWKSKRFKQFLNELKVKHGYHINWLSWNKLKIYYSKRNHNFIDLWPFSRKGKDKLRIKSRMWKVHNASYVLPLRKSKFEGFVIWVPNNPASLLTAEYGSGWQTELTCKKIGEYGNCKA